MPGLLHSVVCTAQTLDFCPFLPLTLFEAGRKVAQEAAIGCLRPGQSLRTRSVIWAPSRYGAVRRVHLSATTPSHKQVVDERRVLSAAIGGDAC